MVFTFPSRCEAGEKGGGGITHSAVIFFVIINRNTVTMDTCDVLKSYFTRGVDAPVYVKAHVSGPACSMIVRPLATKALQIVEEHASDYVCEHIRNKANDLGLRHVVTAHEHGCDVHIPIGHSL